MKALQEHSQPYQDVYEFAKGSVYRLILDENVRHLEPGLEDEGYTVHVLERGLKDEQIKRKIRGAAFVTRNSKDFLRDAIAFDYDVIALEELRFFDSKPDKSNEIVQKIARALRRSNLASRKGNFLLKLRNDGSFALKQLVGKEFLPEGDDLGAPDSAE